jgi:hypothetical protein
MQEEIAALQRRRSKVEDEILELMEYAEPLQNELVQLGERREGLDADAQRALAAIAEQEAAIDGDLQAVRAERDAIASGIPADVIDTYDDLRKRFAGVAVARLEHGACGGCHLALPSAELARIRRLPPDAVVHCEDCGRLLVH